MIVKPVVVYGSETWAVTEMDKKKPSTWERKSSGMILWYNREVKIVSF